MEEINPQPQVVNTPTQVEPVKNNNNSFLVTLLSILLLLSVLIAGFFAYQTQNLVKELTKLQTIPTPVPTNEPATISTDNWKTYTNEKYDFSIQYPEDLELEAREVDIKSNYQDYVEKCKSGIYEGCGGMSWPDYKITFYKENDIAVFDVNIWNGDLTESTDVFKESKFYNNKTYLVSTFRMVYENGKIEALDEKIIKQISSTLTFGGDDKDKVVACTMEAKICPDGSAVGRSGPKCEFTACPITKPTTSPLP